MLSTDYFGINPAVQSLRQYRSVYASNHTCAACAAREASVNFWHYLAVKYPWTPGDTTHDKIRRRLMQNHLRITARIQVRAIPKFQFPACHH